MKIFRSPLAGIVALIAACALLSPLPPRATAATTVVVNSYRFANFLPTDISGLQVWLKADAIVGLSDNDPVSTWSDGSGQSHDATGVTTTRPLFKTGILAGKAVVRFDG